MKYKQIFTATVAIFLCCYSIAQNIPLDTAVHSGRLKNGFTYYIRRNAEPRQRVVMYLVNKVGSVLETDDQRGIAHFIEHMNFNGTKHFPKNELINYLQKAGVRFGPDLNAYTGFDETVYQLPVSSNDPELLENSFRIMRDWAGEATLDPVEIEKERGIIMEEKRLGNGAQQRFQEKIFPVQVNNSRYASRMPIGIDAVILKAPPQILHDFYRDWYRPDLQALIVVGDIDVIATEKSIREKFSDLKNPDKEKPRTKYTILLTGENQFVKVTDKEAGSMGAQISIKHPGKKMITYEAYRDNLVLSLYNSMLSVRFSELSKQADPPFINAGAGIGGILANISAFSASVTAKPGELEKGMKALWTEVQQVKQHGFTSSELKRAKENYLMSSTSAFREKDKKASASYADEYVRNFLDSEASPGIEKEFGLINQYLPGISLEEVNGLSAQYITENNRDIIITGQDGDTLLLPDKATAYGWIQSVEKSTIPAYQDEILDLPLLLSKPTAGKIINEKTISSIGTNILTLSNGAKVILKPTKFKNDEIIFSAYSPGGTSLYNDSDFQSALNAADIVASSGLGRFNPIQLPKLLNGKQVEVIPYISERFEGIEGTTVSKDLETALQLIYLSFTSPRKDSSVFENIISRSKSSLASAANDPGKVFYDTMSAVLGDHNIRRTGPTIEKLNQIDFNKVYKIYKERFANASDFTFLFVGSLDTISLRPLLEQYLGALPSTGRTEAAKDLNIHIPAGNIHKEVRSGKNDKASVRLVISGEYKYSLYNNLQMKALKEILEFHLLERLREHEGGVYTPAVNIAYSKYPSSRYSIHIEFGCAPGNADKLIASTLDEIEKIKKNGPSPDDMQKFKAAESKGLQSSLATNSFWLTYLSSQLQNGDDLTQIRNYNRLIDTVTPAMIKKIANEYLNSKNLISLVWLPE